MMRSGVDMIMNRETDYLFSIDDGTTWFHSTPFPNWDDGVLDKRRLRKKSP